MKKVAVLGSTGSIGTRALEVVASSPELELHSVLCRSSAGMLADQVSRYRPKVVCMTDPAPGEAPPGAVSGDDALAAAIEGSDIVLNAIVGSAGLSASILCMEQGIPLALANKESLVIGGVLLEPHLDAGLVIPVDSEHSTIFRCLHGETRPVLEIVLTASGGAARDIPEGELHGAGPERILRHPTWDMGGRITVDSATMVNKAFEVIEAGWLFRGVPVSSVIHPQSVVHSLVRLGDGAWKALLGTPDMGLPIQYALVWPDGRLEQLADDDPLDWGTLEFGRIDHGRYPAFRTVVLAGEEGGTAPAAANAADEVAVAAFLEGRIPFGAIASVIDQVMGSHTTCAVSSIEDVLEADSLARAKAGSILEGIC